jgi:hypothetical protein
VFFFGAVSPPQKNGPKFQSNIRVDSSCHHVDLKSQPFSGTGSALGSALPLPGSFLGIQTVGLVGHHKKIKAITGPFFLMMIWTVSFGGASPSSWSLPN